MSSEKSSMTWTRAAILGVLIVIAAVVAYPTIQSSGTLSIFGSRVTTSTFEPVYRAAKAVQGGTHSGVTYPAFLELKQRFATEIAIAKDHDLNGADKGLLSLFEESYSDYNASAELWKNMIGRGVDQEALSVIWRDADQILDRATAVYYGKPDPGAAR